MAARKVVLIDNDPQELAILSSLLQLAGHDIRTFTYAGLALNFLNTFNPDVIVMGLNLSDLAGLELADRMRITAKRNRTALVALTGYGGEAIDAKVKAVGFDFHLPKSVHFTVIDRLLDGLPTR